MHVIHVLAKSGVLQPDWPLLHGVHVGSPPQVANTLNLEAMGVFEAPPALALSWDLAGRRSFGPPLAQRAKGDLGVCDCDSNTPTGIVG